MPSSAPTGFLRLTEEVLGAKKLDYTTHLNKLESFTAGTMRNLILVALILKAVLTVDTNGFKFGDIISMQRCGPLGFTYTHFAIYVGEKEDKELGKKEGDNIFERLRDPPICPFSRLKSNEDPQLANYFDEKEDEKEPMYKKGSDEEIMKRINEKYKECGTYKLRSNNCEHLATYVRYGVKVALQLGQSGEGWCKNEGLDTRQLLNYARKPTACKLPSSSVAGG